VGELAIAITGLVGSRSKIIYKPLPVDDPRRRRPDITQAQARLGWSPKVELAVGLHRTIAYFDQQLRRGEPHNPDVHPKTRRVSLSRPTCEEMVL
jgi:UDP-glucuronate decarboxylase